MHHPPYAPSHPHQQQHHHQQPHPHQHPHQHQVQQHQSQLPMPSDMHQPSHAAPSYPGHPVPLPSMPPPAAPYSDLASMQVGAPGAPGPAQSGPPGSDAASQSGSTSQERQLLTPEQQKQQEKNLTPYSQEDGQGRIYSLHVVQQPQRARMCGFGDKDRRPITPPPCVRLSIKDAKTGKEIDCNDIEHTMYVLNVDLWSEDALKEVNLVRHTTASPSISSTSPASYAQIEQATPAFSHILPSNVPSSRDAGYPQQITYQPPSQAVTPYGMSQPYGSPFVSTNGGYAQPGYYRPDYSQDVSLHTPMFGPPRVYESQYGLPPQQRLSIAGTAPAGMFTRNLIGSLAASAFRLQDTEDKIGIWFVLQDLSVRTEGCFRLRFSFVNVGPPMGAQGVSGNGPVNTGRAPVLASVFSDVFQVYSAKKFPGVCESTPLSKCFATQGIKIPIRKEGADKKGGGDDDDADY